MTLHLRGHLTMSEDISSCHSLQGGGVRGGVSMLLASSGWNPEMLFYILQYARQSPIRKNYPVQNVSSAKVKKPSFKGLVWSEPFYLWAYPIPFPHSLHTEEWCPSHSLRTMTHSHTVTVLSAWNVLLAGIHGDHYFTASRPLPTSLF